VTARMNGGDCLWGWLGVGAQQSFLHATVHEAEVQCRASNWISGSAATAASMSRQATRRWASQESRVAGANGPE